MLPLPARGGVSFYIVERNLLLGLDGAKGVDGEGGEVGVEVALGIGHACVVQTRNFSEHGLSLVADVEVVVPECRSEGVVFLDRR